jgi:hypothetical protein
MTSLGGHFNFSATWLKFLLQLRIAWLKSRIEIDLLLEGVVGLSKVSSSMPDTKVEKSSSEYSESTAGI